MKGYTSFSLNQFMIQDFLREDLTDLNRDIMKSISNYENLLIAQKNQEILDFKNVQNSEEIGRFLTEMRKFIRPKILKIIEKSDWGVPLESESQEFLIKKKLSRILKMVDDVNDPEDLKWICFKIKATIQQLRNA